MNIWQAHALKTCSCGIPRPASRLSVHDRAYTDPGQDTCQSSRVGPGLPPSHTVKNKASGIRCPALKRQIIDSREHRETASNRIGYRGTLWSNLQYALLTDAQCESI